MFLHEILREGLVKEKQSHLVREGLHGTQAAQLTPSLLTLRVLESMGIHAALAVHCRPAVLLFLWYDMLFSPPLLYKLLIMIQLLADGVTSGRFFLFLSGEISLK